MGSLVDLRSRMVRSDAPMLELLARLPEPERQRIVAAASKDELDELTHGWRGVRARPEQLAPEVDWRLFVILAGRGFGKTKAGSEWLREEWKKGAKHMGMVGATAADVRDVMVRGPSGICNVGPPDQRPVHEPASMRVVWPDGAIAYTFSADAPERIRGREFDRCWVDELGSFRTELSRAREFRGALGATRAEDAWNNLLFCMRSGSAPKIMVTTTPRPTAIVRRVLRDADVVRRGSSHDNAANLSEAYWGIISGFEGTRIGRQEISGELLEDVEGALWKLSTIEEGRVAEAPALLDRVVVGVDPPGTTAECGIVGVGHVAAAGRSYVLADRSLAGSPEAWASAVVRAFDDLEADVVVIETNFGGDMVKSTLQKIRPNLPIREVRASRGKAVRAEPISLVYEQGRVRHVGALPKLEEELTTWAPGMPSPNRLDALVWAATEFHGKSRPPLVW